MEPEGATGDSLTGPSSANVARDRRRLPLANGPATAPPPRASAGQAGISTSDEGRTPQSFPRQNSGVPFLLPPNVSLSPLRPFLLMAKLAGRVVMATDLGCAAGLERPGAGSVPKSPIPSVTLQTSPLSQENGGGCGQQSPPVLAPHARPPPVGWPCPRDAGRRERRSRGPRLPLRLPVPTESPAPGGRQAGGSSRPFTRGENATVFSVSMNPRFH